MNRFVLHRRLSRAVGRGVLTAGFVVSAAGCATTEDAPTAEPSAATALSGLATPTLSVREADAEACAQRVLPLLVEVAFARADGDMHEVSAIGTRARDALGRQLYLTEGDLSGTHMYIYAESFTNVLIGAESDATEAIDHASARVVHRCRQSFWPDGVTEADIDEFGPRPWVPEDRYGGAAPDASEEGDDDGAGEAWSGVNGDEGSSSEASAQTPYPGYPVSFGDSDATGNGPIAVIQRALRAQGFPEVTPDGVFGPTTERAVREFQKGYGLEADGVVGPATWDALEVE